MKRPKWVKVGPKWFRLKTSRALINECAQTFGYSVDGYTDHADSIIVTDPDLGVEQERVTIVHECIHAWLEDILHSFDATLEEAIVKQLAYVVLGWLRDNPDLIGYLQYTAS